jgi:hypothetical protein
MAQDYFLQQEIEGHSTNRVPTDDGEDAPEPSNGAQRPRPRPRPVNDGETSDVSDEEFSDDM